MGEVYTIGSSVWTSVRYSVGTQGLQHFSSEWRHLPPPSCSDALFSSFPGTLVQKSKKRERKKRERQTARQMYCCLPTCVWMLMRVNKRIGRLCPRRCDDPSAGSISAGCDSSPAFTWRACSLTRGGGGWKKIKIKVSFSISRGRRGCISFFFSLSVLFKREEMRWYKKKFCF